MIVVKVGGGAGIDVEAVLADVAQMWKDGERVVLVHGASDETNQLSEKLGIPPRFVTSASGHVSRFTDAATLDAFAMASGKLNLRVVESLQKRGCNAVGLTGVDGRLLEGQRKEAIKAVVDGKKVMLRGDHTGTIETVNAGLLRLLLSNGYLPVVTVPAISTAGEAVNADADRAAAAIAGALGASHLLILSNVAGLLRDVADPASLIPTIPVAELASYEGFAQGRFKKKILGAREALDLGVPRIVFATANTAAPVTAALQGGGTHVC
ncbi:MAG: [amino group carrier protein]-L-2-aminoadipate 6-kinase [Thermoplasmata archaeon]|jgi:acetylglutamate/LysW-gamma-L-alpha-aminoadipate kinase|nr:[amino group carrier protein]-L-2-aminoadipate 6-kinase [Thermoplasmata archaeon]